MSAGRERQAKRAEALSQGKAGNDYEKASQGQEGKRQGIGEPERKEVTTKGRRAKSSAAAGKARRAN